MPQRGNLSVAIVGYGSTGRRHAENLGRLGVARRVIVRRQHAANPAFTSPVDALVVHSVQQSIAAGIDLAIVCNPTSLHIATAREYLASGVAVLVEKPLAGELAEAERFVADAELSGVPAGMAYCLRYHPAYLLAHEYVCRGELGRMERVRAWFESYLPEWHPWEDYRQSYAARAELGGGVLPTLDHEIDFINWCFGPPPTTRGVSSRSGLLDADVDDEATLTMHYGSFESEIRLSLSQRDRRRGFEMVGSEATLSFSFEQQLLRLARRETGREEILWHEPEFDLNRMYLGLLDDALSAVAARRQMPVPLWTGLHALRVAAAVQRSPGAA
ncbi:MAG TPA: Gfo/Idh/MocA family oxidoreductase [Pirellulales bacterium]|nr:Gfo/Idh/MocA family oxidoreductase [Pirellulales bacterium]